MIKKSNRTRILEYIFRHAPVSRATIAEETDITPATVTTTTAALIAEGAVKELGEIEQTEERTPGRKRISIAIEAAYRYSIGIEFNEKHLVCCLVNLRGEVQEKWIKPMTKELQVHLTEGIIQQIQKVLDSHLEKAQQLIGIGIAVPGKLSEDEEKLITDTPIWKDFSAKKIRQSFGLPIVFENNIRCMAFGQYLFNPSHTPDRCALFHVGMGMYCANIVEGTLAKEDRYISGEIGHTIVKVEGKKCKCGKYGCLQTYMSEKGLLDTAKILVDTKADTVLHQMVETSDALTIEHIISAYQLGDEAISRYLTEGLKYLSMTIANISIILNPTKIFLHGYLLSEKAIEEHLRTYIERDLNFMGNNYASHIEILPYDLTNAARGAAAKGVEAFFINKNL